jgi:undecaprenyl pyrophosphate phosphatase UppP
MIGRLILATVLSGTLALSMTWGLFSVPQFVEWVSESDMLLVMWYLATIGSAMVVFWLSMRIG